MSLELREDPQMMDQGDIALTKQRVIRFPAQGQVASQAAINPGKERLGLPLGVPAQMQARPFGISWVDLLDEEENTCQREMD